MSNTPDFVNQVQEIEHDLDTEWQSIQKGWRDYVAERFNEKVMKPYLQNFRQYITGEGISGCGLEQLLQLMEQHLQEMTSIAGN